MDAKTRTVLKLLLMLIIIKSTCKALECYKSNCKGKPKEEIEESKGRSSDRILTDGFQIFTDIPLGVGHGPRQPKLLYL